MEKLVFKFVWDKIELVLTNISGIEAPKQNSIAKKTQKKVQLCHYFSDFSVGFVFSASFGKLL